MLCAARAAPPISSISPLGSAPRRMNSCCRKLSSDSGTPTARRLEMSFASRFVRFVLLSISSWAMRSWMVDSIWPVSVLRNLAAERRRFRAPRFRDLRLPPSSAISDMEKVCAERPMSIRRALSMDSGRARPASSRASCRPSMSSSFASSVPVPASCIAESPAIPMAFSLAASWCPSNSGSAAVSDDAKLIRRYVREAPAAPRPLPFAALAFATGEGVLLALSLSRSMLYSTVRASQRK
mmetsp:Transcript_92311/g.206655  ORF Transcript_92311/g.206655 Transcript_92311/m.206655 type:complete len:239 (+) Transcript_92311:292-1008(+)